MAFVNPTLIWGLLFASLPILIYYLLRHRWKMVEWGAMQILLEILEEQKRRMRLLEIILLALRTLMFAALAAGLARPLLTSQLGASLLGTSGDVLIVLDASYSMQTGQGAGTRFDRAKEEALRILEETPRGFGVSLLLASELPDPIIASFSTDHELMAETIRSLEASDLAGDSRVTLEVAKDLLETSERAIRRCFVISDYQIRDWDGSEQSFLDLTRELGDNADLTLVPVTDGLTENTAVSDIHISAGAVRTGAQAIITGSIHNHGQVEAQDVAVDLLIDRVVMESTSISVPSQASTTVRFPFIAIEPGMHAATIRIRHDLCPADNARYLPFEVVDAVRVLAVIDDAAPLTGARASDFIEICLNPYPERGDHPDAIYAVTTIQASDLLVEDLQDYELVVMAQVDAPSEIQIEMLEHYIRGGGGALVFLGPQADIEAWNQRAHRDGSGILPWPLLPEPMREDDENQAMVFTPEGAGHPVWANLVGGRTDYFEQVRFYESFAFDAIGGDRAVTLGTARNSSTGSTRPVFIDADLGRGQALILASSADLSMNNFAVRKVYVGLINQAVAYLRSFRHGDTTVEVGQRAHRFVDFQRSQASYRITAPDGDEFGASVEHRDDEYRLSLPPLLSAGFYRIVNQNDPADTSVVAANVSIEEGDISERSTFELAQIFDGLPVTIVSEDEDTTTHTSALGGVDLATLLLIIVLLCWFGSNFIAHKITRL